MTTDRTPEYLISLIKELCKLPRETEWVEFKANKADPQEIGEYLSALANSAALAGKAFAYIVWGIENESHRIVGTNFSHASAKVGNEELENWLLRLLSPKLHFRFFETDVDGYTVVLLEIPRAFRHPVQFQHQEFIRIGSYKKKLKDFPEKERELWRIFDQTPFEELIAVDKVSSDDSLVLLDYPAYFDLLKLPLQDSRDGILQALLADKLIC
jgi:ATP-dependent DNA helicase RecG